MSILENSAVWANQYEAKLANSRFPAKSANVKQHLQFK